MNTVGLVVWISIFIVVAVLCIIVYKVLTNDWYENRKKELRWGLLGCFSSVAFFLFGPLVTMGKKIDFIAGMLHDLIYQKVNEMIAPASDILNVGGLDLSELGLASGSTSEPVNEIADEISSVIMSFIRFPDLSSPKIQITIAATGTVLIIVFIACMICFIKEQKKEYQIDGKRNHLFEIQESAYNELTKKRG